MVTRLLPVFVCAALLLGFSACKKSPKDLKAEQDAKWRVEQKQKAIKNYQEIVKKYPESPFASKAKERLSALGPASSPGKK